MVRGMHDAAVVGSGTGADGGRGGTGEQAKEIGPETTPRRTADRDAIDIVVVSPGANTAVSVEHARAAGPLLTGAKAVVCQLEIPDDAVAEAVRLAGGTVVLNPSPAKPVAQSVLERIDAVLVNRSELAVLTGAPEPETVEAARPLATGLAGPCPVPAAQGPAPQEVQGPVRAAEDDHAMRHPVRVRATWRPRSRPPGRRRPWSRRP